MSSYKIVYYDTRSLEDEASSSTSKTLRKCKVVNVKYPLTEIESHTIVIYFGSEDGVLDEQLEEIDRKFVILRDYRNHSKKCGEIIRRDWNNYIIYGCIIKVKNTDPFSFKNFMKCISQIQKNNKKDKFSYVGFQVFEDKKDNLIVSKIVNLLRYAMTYVDVYVCWPKHLEQFMPQF